MTLSQVSLQTGALAPAMATQMALDPVASLCSAYARFDESIHDDDRRRAVASLAALGGDGRRARRRWRVRAAGDQAPAYAAAPSAPRTAPPCGGARRRSRSPGRSPARRRAGSRCRPAASPSAPSAQTIPSAGDELHVRHPERALEVGARAAQDEHAGADDHEREQRPDRDELAEHVDRHAARRRRAPATPQTTVANDRRLEPLADPAEAPAAASRPRTSA